MFDHTIVCSVCIPTWNRDHSLKSTLESIVSEKSFADGRVEIVISDNNSSDETSRLALSYQEKYPGRVNCFRQERSIDPHLNFQFALEHGRGRFLKLTTDHMQYDRGALDNLVDALEQHGDDYAFFIPVRERKNAASTRIDSVEYLIREISYKLTAINYFCIERSAYYSLGDPFRAWENNFPHVDMLLRLLDSGRPGCIVDHAGQSGLQVKFAADRNNARIFGVNYLNLLNAEFDKGKLSSKTLVREKRLLLFSYIIPMHFDFFHQYNSYSRPLPFFRYMKNYRNCWFFYGAILWIGVYWFGSNVIPLHQWLGGLKRRLKQH
ncbi:MAG: glycosyltransferase [Victivallaceae bacterium]|nr:glycosyltransferase [Victivallaceae bacterium]